MRTNENGGLANRVCLLVWLGVFGLSAGCVSVEAPEEIRIGSDTYYDRDDRRDRDDGPHHEARRKVDKDEAYAIARKVVRREQVTPRDYEIHDKGINDARWVLFEHRRPTRRRDWRNHLAVRVGPYGRSTLYARDYRRHPSSWDERKVDKDDAYRIARRLADRRGVDLDIYEIHDKEIDDVYWVLFECKHPKRSRGWRNYFTIRVGPFGAATFYTGDG